MNSCIIQSSHTIKEAMEQMEDASDDEDGVMHAV